MCMIDGSDGLVTVLSESDPIANKQHMCAECFRNISPGEQYHVDRYVFDGEFSNHKTCAHCMVARAWLQAECGGWLYCGVEEDVRDHVTNGYTYPVGVYRLVVGMSRKWRTPRGKLLPIPKLPQTTHARVTT